MNNANKKFYFSVATEEERGSFLTKATTEKLIAEVWQKGQDKSKIEEFEILAHDSTLHKLTLKLRSGLLGKLAGSKNRDQNVLVKISFGSIYIFSSSKLIFNKDEDSYSVTIDKDIYKSQQRSNYRLNANRFIRIQFKILGAVYEADDISAGGTSFIISKENEDKFVKDALHEDCIIRMANNNFDLPKVKVAGIWPHSFEDETGNLVNGFKIGISFIDLPKITEEALFLSINTEARGEEMRKQAIAKKAGKST